MSKCSHGYLKLQKYLLLLKIWLPKFKFGLVVGLAWLDMVSLNVQQNSHMLGSWWRVLYCSPLYCTIILCNTLPSKRQKCLGYQLDKFLKVWCCAETQWCEIFCRNTLSRMQFHIQVHFYFCNVCMQFE